MARSTFKGLFFARSLFKTSLEFFPRRVYFRSSFIPAQLANSVVSVYNGKIFKDFKVTGLFFGYRFGEFVLTRSLFVPKKKKQKQKNKSKKPKK